MTHIEFAKKEAAYKAIDENVHDGYVIGIGSGSTVVYAIERLVERIKNEKLDIVCIPTSFQARQLIVDNQLKLGEFAAYPQPDLCIDSADDVDSKLTLVKGSNGCMLQEKIMANCAKVFIIIADYTQESELLGDRYMGIPIEVVPFGYTHTKKEIERRFKGEARLRMSVAKAGPVVTDNGNFILDWENLSQLSDWEDINTQLCSLPGVVETGLFVKMAKIVYFGQADYSVVTKTTGKVKMFFSAWYKTNAILTLTSNSVKYLCKNFMIMNAVESGKKAAAYKAVDDNVKDKYVIGIGSGSTIIYAVERLAERVKNEDLNVVCIPTSFQSTQLIIDHQLKLGELNVYPELDVCIDGADEIDSKLNLIKGGGGCLLQEKIVANCAKVLAIVADYGKRSEFLGDNYKKGIPIEIVPFGYVPIKNEIERRFKGNAVLRMAIAKAGPVITDNGNFILDWKNHSQLYDLETINTLLCNIPGVVETGLFIKMTKVVYFGHGDGTVHTSYSESK
ncbi:hypothetical protein FQA39_LY08527 [Lamprigera yunnana]|nr:hypothetical protein FQA39_LY08527 [Lamprigera yunnana]